MKGQRGEADGCFAVFLLFIFLLLLWAGLTLVVNGHPYHFELRIGN